MDLFLVEKMLCKYVADHPDVSSDDFVEVIDELELAKKKLQLLDEVLYVVDKAKIASTKV